MGMIRLLGVLLALSGLAACGTAGGSTPMIPEPYSSRTVKLDVKDVTVVKAFDTTSWSAGDRMTSDRLIDGIGAWARSRLAPAGPSGSAKVIVQNASIGEQVQRVQTSALTMDRVTVIDGIVDVRIEAIDRRTSRVAFSDVVVRRQATTSAGSPPEERERIRADMARDMMREMDDRLDGEVRRRMGSVILP